MTLPTNSTSTVAEDDSDMFGPPHSSPPIRRNRPKVPMISPQLKQREVRKRILQLCVHKLERIKDSERNLRRSVCINNTYSRLTDDIRREKQHKLLMLSNLAKSTDSSRKESEEDDPSADDCINNNITNANNNNSNNTNGSSNNHHHHLHPHHHHHGEHGEFVHNNENMNNNCQLQHNHNLASHQHHYHHLHHHLIHQRLPHPHSAPHTDCNGTSSSSDSSTSSSSCSELLTSTTMTTNGSTEASDCSKPSGATVPSSRKSSSEVETDLETLDRELCALDAAMPLVDPEITQGAEQLEQAMVSRKRKFASIDDDDSDRLVREALSQIYFPSAGRLLTGIDDCPPTTTTDGGAEGGTVEDQQSKVTSVSETIGDLSPKRPKIGDLLEHHHHHHHHHHYQLHPFSHPFLHPFHPLPDLSGFDYQVAHHHQKEFEVIMDALRLGVSNGGAMAAVVAAKSAGAVAAAAAAAAAATGNAAGTAMGCGVGGAAAGNGHGQPVANCNTAGGANSIAPTPTTTIDSCGQAAMLMGSDGGASVFHNLVVTSLET